MRLFLSKCLQMLAEFYLKMKQEIKVVFSYDSDGRRDEFVDSTFNAQVCVKTLHCLLLNNYYRVTVKLMVHGFLLFFCRVRDLPKNGINGQSRLELEPIHRYRKKRP
jgi:hypothetical protein